MDVRNIATSKSRVLTHDVEVDFDVGYSANIGGHFVLQEMLLSSGELLSTDGCSTLPVRNTVGVEWMG